MQFFKRFGALILIVIIVFSLSAPCFATPAAVTGIDFFTAAFQTFIEICGLTTVLSSNGVVSDSSDPYSQVQLTDQYQSLFDEYQSSISSSDTISDWYSTYSNSISVVPDQTTSILSPTIDAQLSEWFSDFASWIMSDKYDLTVTPSGVSHTSGSFDSPLVSDSVVAGIVVPVVNAKWSAAYPSAVRIGYDINGSDIRVVCRVTNSSDAAAASGKFRCAVTLDNDKYVPVLIWMPSELSSYSDFGQFSIGVYVDDSFTGGYSINITGVNSDDSVLSPYKASIFNPNNIYSMDPDDLFVPIVDIGTSSAGVAVSDTITLRPKDKYNEDPIPIPDTTASDYVPEALTGEYSDAITGALTGFQNLTLDQILQAVLDVTLTNTEVIADEAVDPLPPDLTPVEIPFLGFTLPSFNLGLSSIWQYVIDWVGSLGSGISFIGSVWSNLPYAMVIPIYASAVVVIVLGMFKRFLL